MDLQRDRNPLTTKGTLKAVDSKNEFTAAKPLPPIGSVGKGEESDNDERQSEDTRSLDRDDARSSLSQGSTSAFDRPGEGSARPRIIRGFRPEVYSDEEDFDEDKKLVRRVSFTEAKERMFRGKSPVQRETTRRKTYDGREVTLVSLDTQTDWDWVSDVEAGTARSLDSERSTIDETPRTVQKSEAKEESSVEAQLPTEGSSYNMPYNDEYGIPILDLSSDTDDSSDEEYTAKKKIKDERNFIPSVGPPQILQYQRESQKEDIDVEDPESRLPKIEDEEELPKDEEGLTIGMFSGTCEFCKKPVKPFPTLDQQLQLPPEELYCCNDYREFVEYVLNTTAELEKEQKEKTKLISVKVHEHVGSKQERNAAKEKAVQRMRERELQRRQQEATGLQQNFFAFARQMKTINYQLSSQKCLEEGWTLRAPSPLLDDIGDNVFEPEPLDPAMIAEGRLRERPLIEKFYEHGQKFLTMFPDGTGNVFYPSGNLAILISSVKLGQYNYTIHQDVPRPEVAAAFEPSGYGYCYYPNGDVRLYIDQYGGIELDRSGGKKRKWQWKDHVTHVHAPPFQPICIGLNSHLAVRVMSQENIVLTFSANQRSGRFNMGSRLKLVAPENVPLKEIEEDYIFLEEKKNYVGTLLDKVSTLLRFPNSPKIDKILPPIHVTNKITKTERLKEERKSLLAQQSARDKKQSAISVT